MHCRCLRCGAVRLRSGSAILIAASTTPSTETELPTTAAPTKTGRSRRTKAKPSCESCYFGVRMLCALELGEPCTTFRPDSPQGLTPPAQPMLLIGAEGATLDTEPQPLAA
jgi:hypothetical protein